MINLYNMDCMEAMAKMPGEGDVSKVKNLLISYIKPIFFVERRGEI